MTIGERIRNKRIELNMTQDELAKKVGYRSRSSIQKIECARDLPLKKVSKMAAALDTTPGYLMGWNTESITVSGHDDVEIISVSSLPYTKEEQKAKELFELYQNASPDVQQAVELILKSSQQQG